MQRTRWLMTIFLAGLLLTSACKKGVESASESVKNQAEKHYSKARRLFLSCDPDQYPEAIKEYQLALNLWDEYPEALAGLAEAISMWRGFNLTEKEFGDAYQYAQRALRLNPELAAGYRAMADLTRHRRDNERALRQIEMALRIEPDNAEDLYVKGSALLDINPEEAYKVLLEARNQNPELAKVYFNLASACQKMGRFDEAIGYLEKYQKMVPSDISAYCALGMNKLSKVSKDTPKEQQKALDSEAVALFQTAIAKSSPQQKIWQIPWVLMAYKTMARMDFANGQYQDALAKLKKAEEVYQQDVELQYLLGAIYKKTGDRKSAKEHLLKAQELAPKNEDIKKELKGL